MSKTLLPIKSLWLPRAFYWILGIIHGRILHTAAIDPDSETLTSGFVVNMTKRFAEGCITRADRGRENLKEYWPDANCAVSEIAACDASLSQEPKETPSNVSGALARAREARARKHVDTLAKRAEAMSRLITSKDAIQDELAHAQNQVDATAERLLSVFGSYAHGVLRKPVRQRDLPVLSVENMTARILAAPNPVEAGREDDWRAIQELIKEATDK